jgi:hypothetical protein
VNDVARAAPAPAPWAAPSRRDTRALTPVAFDTETFLIGPGAVAPQVVCGSFYAGPQAGPPVLLAKPDGLHQAIKEMLLAPTPIVVHNACFDAAATSATWPDLLPLWFAAYDAGRVYCTKIREKLLNLSTHGKLDMLTIPNGATKKISYKLATLVLDYFGEDRSEEKGEESWRLNYSLLAGKPAAAYPPDAANYAKQDAVDHWRVFVAQEERLLQAQAKGYDGASMATQALQAGADFALLLMTCWGLRIDPVKLAAIEDELARELAPEKMAVLYEQKILRPAIPSRPYANGAVGPDGLPKLTAEIPESVDTKVLQAYVADVCRRTGVEVKRTPTGNISTDKDIMGQIAHRDPVLGVWEHRQGFQKLKNTEVPRISGLVMHAPFDIIKETGRTSSYEAKLKAGAPTRAMYPSWNGQNVHPLIRPVVVPRPGYLLFSIDYHAIDLVALAQVCLWLFGKSVLAEGFNADIDPHAYLGSQLAAHLDRRFGEVTRSFSPADVFKTFASTKSGWPAALGPAPAPPPGGWKGGSFFKHYRTFAKPTGLGYPGGLGPDTFIDFARSPYGVIVTRDEAVTLRDIWKATYPEMAQYLARINEMTDRTSIGEEETLYRYISPCGMVRARASYCATANGFGLQTPEAEGMKLACFDLQRACYDRSIGSPLFGKVRPALMIHDEIVGEVAWAPGSEDETTALMGEVGRIMVTAMRKVLPDVKVKTSPVLMRRWYKEAEPVYDAKKRLVPWEPKA